MKKQSIIGIIIAFILGVAGVSGYQMLGNSSISNTMDRITIVGTSTSSPASIDGLATTSVVVLAGSDYTQVDLNVVANVSTTETISIKPQFSNDSNCANTPNNVIWYGKSMLYDSTSTSNTVANDQLYTMTTDGNYKFTITERLAAQCIKFSIYNSSTTVSSTVYAETILRNK